MTGVRSVQATLEPAGGSNGEPLPAWRDSFRVKLFAWVSVPILLTGLAYTLLQPAVYRSAATVLMSPPEAFDSSGFEANPQLAAIQSRILLGTSILANTAAALESMQPGFNSIDLRALVHVTPVEGTNLLELAAEGPDASLLSPVIRTWTKVYGEVRADEVRQSQESTSNQVDNELDALAERLESARLELAAFRRDNNIVSLERRENDVMARLSALNDAASDALAEEFKAKAQLDTLREAYDRGEQVFAPYERAAIEKDMQELASMKARLLELDKRYTREYIQRDPQLRDIPDQVAELEQNLEQRLKISQRTAVANTEQSYAAARQNRLQIDAEREAHQAEVARFSDTYARHEALKSDLAHLEQLNRETQERLVRLQISATDKYPQVTVIDGPGLVAEKVGPDYPLLLGATSALSVGGAILIVWLYGFLRPQQEPPAQITLSGVHMYPADTQGLPGVKPPPLMRKEDLAITEEPNGPTEGSGDDGRL